MRVYPPGSEPLMVALLSGHTTVVEPGGSDVDPRFLKEAMARGCRLEGTADSAMPVTPSIDRRAMIRSAIDQLLDSNDAAAFTKGGTPNLKKVMDIVGFSVSAEELDMIWDAVKQEVGHA